MDYLSNSFIEDVYNTLQDELIPEARVPNVRNLFYNGSPCDLAYSEMHRAYMHLLDRLNEVDEDHDVETIIGSFLTISRILGEEMYRCGAHFALQAIDEQKKQRHV